MANKSARDPDAILDREIVRLKAEIKQVQEQVVACRRDLLAVSLLELAYGSRKAIVAPARKTLDQIREEDEQEIAQLESWQRYLVARMGVFHALRTRRRQAILQKRIRELAQARQAIGRD